MYGRGGESHPEVQKGSGGPPRGPGGERSSIWRFGSGREAHVEDREGSGGDGKPTQESTWGMEAYPEVRQGSKAHPEVV